MDASTLARIQFGLNIGFHYLFPPLSIGLGVVLVILEGCFLWAKNPIFEKLTKFWVSIFALIFALGVATGLVMVFAFGNNWAVFSRFVGDVFGSILGAEGIFAFFLESGFLGILLFGWHRVGPKVHFLSTVMVAIGSHFSAIWIVIANSWMQTPAGHLIVGEGSSRHAIIESFWAVITNPSALTRLSHVIVGAWLAGAFLVLSVSAYYILKKRHMEAAMKSFKVSLIMAAICVCLQFIAGDASGREVAEYQPIKLAAFEGVYQSETPTGMYAFGFVNEKEQKVTGLRLPGLLSFLVYHTFSKGVPGLDQYPQDLWPKIGVVFQTYHGMITMWGLMVLGVVLAFYALWRKKLFESKWTLRFLVISVVFPELANELGWMSAEMGRQPWVVQGLLKTKDAISPTVSAGQIIFSLVLFSIVYLLLFILFIYLLNKKIMHGLPEEPEIYEYHNQNIYGENPR